MADDPNEDTWLYGSSNPEPPEEGANDNNSNPEIDNADEKEKILTVEKSEKEPVSSMANLF